MKTEREIKVKEFTEYKVGFLDCPKCGMRLEVIHRETPHKRRASHRLEYAPWLEDVEAEK